jgi:hypothetical protein
MGRGGQNFVVHRVASLCIVKVLDPVDPSFPVLSRRLQFTHRRHKFNADSLSASLDPLEHLTSQGQSAIPALRIWGLGFMFQTTPEGGCRESASESFSVLGLRV